MANIEQSHFRFGKDDGTEAAHTFWQLEDVNHTQLIAANWTFLLRFCEQVTTAVSNVFAQFQYNKNGAGWVNITTTSSIVKAVAVNAFNDGANCTKRLSGTGTFESSGSGCDETGVSGGTTNDIVLNGNSETEAGLQVVFANVANNDTIQFRLTSLDGTMVYTVTPTLTITKSVDTLVTPGLLSLTLTPYIPLVIEGMVVVPGLLTLTITPYVPDVIVASGGTEVIPGTLNLIITLFTPTVTATDNKTVTPGTLGLVLSPYTPNVSIGIILTPGVLALILTPYIPTVIVAQNTLVTPGTLALILTAYAPLALLFTTYGGTFLWTSANWGTVNIYLEVYMRATTGTVYSRLIDNDNNVVTNSEVSTALTTFQRLRSSALTLTNGKTYRSQFGKAGGDAGEFLEAKVVVIPV